ncbi:hypothetical protein CEW89_08505 [Celeribacter ethanolicus]|uniref:Uncharacterized protein n=1 Tax=Celeribacter ethanolicus TaxID=1758178 RepID=A0A291GC54_9RHOB|nr:hypothetical protein [Celeribacter ethanolicus]ATG47612.1 hypothetical protein CEW89_08505 [Celeribacter ethanolicus]
MSEEWGPWIEHDGTPRPELLGCYMAVVSLSGREEEGIQNACDAPPPGMCCAFVWASLPDWRVGDAIVRYRIRKPRALLDLIEMVEALPAPSRPVSRPVEVVS